MTNYDPEDEEIIGFRIGHRDICSDCYPAYRERIETARPRVRRVIRCEGYNKRAKKEIPIYESQLPNDTGVECDLCGLVFGIGN